jgi:NADP-dependent 3-hydroxy acid dehydrogenase YdfG
MVSLKEVRESNSALKTSLPNPTAFFAGGTSGIGEATLKELAKQTLKPKIYFAARSDKTADKLKKELKKLNPDGEYISIKAEDLTLLKDVDRVCEEFKGKETKLDLLFLSQGWLNLEGRNGEILMPSQTSNRLVQRQLTHV